MSKKPVRPTFGLITAKSGEIADFPNRKALSLSDFGLIKIHAFFEKYRKYQYVKNG